jgi:hypothetical protein
MPDFFVSLRIVAIKQDDFVREKFLISLHDFRKNPVRFQPVFMMKHM